VIVEMLARDRFVRRIEPLHLTQARAGGDEMRQIDGARLVVVRQVAELAPVRSDLDDCERGVGQGVDSGGRPRFCGRHAGHQADGESERDDRASHVGSPPRSI